MDGFDAGIIGLERPRKLVPVGTERLRAAKQSYAPRRVPHLLATHLLVDTRPRPGDLVLAGVVELGQHQHLESDAGRRAQLYPGDEVIVCYGNRYAPDQFEAVVPEDLAPCHLVAAGGIAAKVLTRHGKMKRATTIAPIGILADAQARRLNLAEWALGPAPSTAARPPVLAVLGTSMNAGKTTTAASVIKGLVHDGYKVGAAKITGTGAGGDRWSMLDAGADIVLDFTDAGYASTFKLSPVEIDGILVQLVGHLAASGAEVIVLEVADGLFQEETAALARSPLFAAHVDTVLFAAGDAMGACAGVAWLREAGLGVAAVSGLLTASPLAVREAAAATRLPVLTRDALTAGGWYAAQRRQSSAAA